MESKQKSLSYIGNVHQKQLAHKDMKTRRPELETIIKFKL